MTVSRCLCSNPRISLKKALPLLLGSNLPSRNPRLPFDRATHLEAPPESQEENRVVPLIVIRALILCSLIPQAQPEIILRRSSIITTLGILHKTRAILRTLPTSHATLLTSHATLLTSHATLLTSNVSLLTKIPFAMKTTQSRARIIRHLLRLNRDQSHQVQRPSTCVTITINRRSGLRAAITDGVLMLFVEGKKTATIHSACRRCLRQGDLVAAVVPVVIKIPLSKFLLFLCQNRKAVQNIRRNAVEENLHHITIIIAG